VISRPSHARDVDGAAGDRSSQVDGGDGGDVVDVRERDSRQGNPAMSKATPPVEVVDRSGLLSAGGDGADWTLHESGW